MKVATGIKISTLIVSLAVACIAETASAQDHKDFTETFYMVCTGTDYSPPGVETYNPVLRSDAIHVKPGERQKAVEYITNKWAHNHPADTWGCRVFDDIGAEYGYANGLAQRNYKGYTFGDFRFELPEKVGWVGGY